MHYFTVCNFHIFTRYSDRVMISNKQTQVLLKEYAVKGITQEQFTQLLVLAGSHVPCILDLLHHLRKLDDAKLIKAPSQWSDFIATIASSSPVCATVHPSDKLFLFLHKLSDATYNVLGSVDSMQYLRMEIPVLFHLLQSLKYFPHKLLTPIIRQLIEKAAAPFTSSTITQPHLFETVSDDLSYFPKLPVNCPRPTYAADKKLQKKICTKKGTRHPTLLPGVFTIFCQHGN